MGDKRLILNKTEMTEVPWQSFEEGINGLREVSMLERFYCITLEILPAGYVFEEPENILIPKFMRNVLVMEVLASLSSVVAAQGLMISNIVRELSSLLSVRMI